MKRPSIRLTVIFLACAIILAATSFGYASFVEHRAACVSYLGDAFHGVLFSPFQWIQDLSSPYLHDRGCLVLQDGHWVSAAKNEIVVLGGPGPYNPSPLGTYGEGIAIFMGGTALSPKGFYDYYASNPQYSVTTTTITQQERAAFGSGGSGFSLPASCTVEWQAIDRNNLGAGGPGGCY
jgi:hypothetical protein